MAWLLVGTSGWNYPEWKDDFYGGVPRRRWLAHYATRFAAVEVNATFRRSMKPETLARWRDETPDGFRFATKGHRVVTHINRLAGVGESIQQQRDNLEPLAGKLAAVLWQTPARFGKDSRLLQSFIAALGTWREVRHVIEFRDPSWFDDETAELLRAHGVASAISDAGRWPRFDAVTADLATSVCTDVPIPTGRPTVATALPNGPIVRGRGSMRAWTSRSISTTRCWVLRPRMPRRSRSC